MQPPPLAVIAHDELSFQICFKFSRRRLKFKNYSAATPCTSAPSNYNLPTRFALNALPGWLVRISLVRSERDNNAPLEKFRHRTTILILP
jgi:hypothetical protein